MSTKEWISDLTNSVGVYQECIYDSGNHVVNPNPAVIQLDHSAGTTISHKMINDELGSRFTLEASLPATTFDKIATDWCKKRSLNTNKYSLKELLSRNNVPQRYHTGESTNVLEETLGVFEFTHTTKERSEQPEIEAALEMDKIFSMLTSDPVEAGYLQECGNEWLKLREAGRNLTKKFPILTKIGSEDEHGKALMLMEMLLEDYDNNLLLIDALSCSIARFEADDDLSE